MEITMMLVLGEVLWPLVQEFAATFVVDWLKENHQSVDDLKPVKRAAARTEKMMGNDRIGPALRQWWANGGLESSLSITADERPEVGAVSSFLFAAKHQLHWDITEEKAAEILSTFFRALDDEWLRVFPEYKDRKDRYRAAALSKQLVELDASVRVLVRAYVRATARRPVYLSAADQELEFLHGVDFEKSLVLNLMFQEHILIPDIFFFFSRSLVNHIAAGVKSSLVGEALARGIIVPSFRDAQWATFSDAYLGFKAMDKKDLVANASYIANRLDRCLEKDASPQIQYWPSYAVAGEFHKRLLSDLVTKDDLPPAHLVPATSTSWLENQWVRTREWRRPEFFQKAIDRNEKHERGLARLHLLTQLSATALPGIDGKTSITSYSEIGSHVSKLPPHKAEAFHTYWSWVTEVYEYNQAVCFGAAASCPTYDRQQNIVATKELMNLRGEGTDRVTFVVDFPAADVLARVDPDVLMGIRKDAEGYWAALEDWYVSPGDIERQRELERMLREYAEEVVRWAKRDQNFARAELEVTLDVNAIPESSARGLTILRGGRSETYAVRTPVVLEAPVAGGRQIDHEVSFPARPQGSL